MLVVLSVIDSCIKDTIPQTLASQAKKVLRTAQVVATTKR